MASFAERFRSNWNAFFNNKDPANLTYYGQGEVSTYRPDRVRLTMGNERSIINSIINRLAVDVASIDIKHVRVDENGRYKEDCDSYFNECLTCSANIDQTGRAFLKDAALSLFDEGCIAIVPTSTTSNPVLSDSYDICTLRVAKILEWYPAQVKVRVYNESTGRKEDLILPKKMVSIVENPFYSVMNEPNSTLKRLILKLNLLDSVDKQSGSGKLDLIVQLPYALRTDSQKVQAENRRKVIEDQLAGSQYGIAYIDGTEKVTQLNRSLENNLMGQIEYLTKLLYTQLGLTEEIMNGTASEEVMLNYYNRTIEPIVAAISEEMERKFLTKTARSQGQAIKYFRDPFKLAPVNKISEMADKFTRNEIMTSNEVRAIVGMKPSSDPAADELRNKNLNQSNEAKGSGNGQPAANSSGGLPTPDQLSQL